MTIPTQVTTNSAVGNAEDIEDILYNDDPEDTPFLTSIDRETATNKLHQWQTIGLDAPSITNAVIEGDDPSTDTGNTSTLLSNSVQLFDKVARVSSSQQSVQSYGRDDELALQTVLKTKSMRRDMECQLLANTAEVTGTDTQARVLGGIMTWFTSNVSRGVGGSSGGLGNTTATAGTQRDLTETLLNDVIKSCFQNGGDPDTLMVGPSHKILITSVFQGNTNRNISAEAKRVVASVDTYDGPFGMMKVIPNRFMAGTTQVSGGAGIRDILVLQMDRWACAYLQPVQMQKLAKTGHSDRNMVFAEMTLVSRNQKTSGVIADLNF